MSKYTVRLTYKASIDVVVDVDDRDLGNESEGVAMDAAMTKAEQAPMTDFELCEQLESVILSHEE